jgi:hypothetical protein
MKQKSPTKTAVAVVTLRPAQIAASYGITRPKLYQLFNSGLPSIRLTGRQGRKGVRLVRVTDLEAYLDQHTEKTAS